MHDQVMAQSEIWKDIIHAVAGFLSENNIKCLVKDNCIRLTNNYKFGYIRFTCDGLYVHGDNCSFYASYTEDFMVGLDVEHIKKYESDNIIHDIVDDDDNRACSTKICNSWGPDNERSYEYDTYVNKVGLMDYINNKLHELNRKINKIKLKKIELEQIKKYVECNNTTVEINSALASIVSKI